MPVLTTYALEDWKVKQTDHKINKEVVILMNILGEFRGKTVKIEEIMPKSSVDEPFTAEATIESLLDSGVMIRIDNSEVPSYIDKYGKNLGFISYEKLLKEEIAIYGAQNNKIYPLR